MRSFLIVFLTVGFCLFAQSNWPVSFSAGFKLGAPINDSSSRNSLYSQYTQGHWTGGPSFEVHMPYRFSIEFDALYHNSRLNQELPFQLGPSLNTFSYASVQKTNSWDYPLLLKYRFQVRSLHPFVSAGYQWTHNSNRSVASYSCIGPRGSCTPSDYPAPVGGTFRSSNTQGGPAAGVGVDFKTRYMSISPEVRFNRPAEASPRDNRFTALVGFSFGTRK